MPAAAQAWASATSSNVLRRTSGSRPSASIAGASAPAHPAAFGGENREAEPARLDVHQLGAAAELRALLGDLERPARVDLRPQRAELAREGEHGDTERGDPEQRGHEADGEPALGRRLVAVEQRQHREGDRQRGGAAQRRATPHARARRSTHMARRRAPKSARRPARPRRPRQARPPPTRRPRRPTTTTARAPSSTAMSTHQTVRCAASSLDPVGPSARRGCAARRRA